MTRSLTKTELLDRLHGLADAQLDALIAQGVVVPVQSSQGPLFRDVDEARLRLILDLEDAFALDEDGIALVMSLVDQVHQLRGDMQAMLRAVSVEEPATRARLREVILQTRISWRDDGPQQG